MRHRYGGQEPAVVLGPLHHDVRVLDRHQPRGHAHLRDSSRRPGRVAAADYAMRRSHYDVRTHYGLAVSAHPPRACLDVQLDDSLSQQPLSVAELPVAADVGLHCHQHVSDRERHLSLPADDSRHGGRARQSPRDGARRCTAFWRWDGVAPNASGSGSRRPISIMAIIIIPVAVSVHTIVSWDFAMTLMPMWRSTIFGPYFVVGRDLFGYRGAADCDGRDPQVLQARELPAAGPLRQPGEDAARP